MTGNGRPRITVFGAGPAGLMAAEVAARAGAVVTVYDRMPAPGRKFLLAGRGGLNLTHSEEFAALLGRYGQAEQRLRPALETLPPAALRAWCDGLGQETFVGSSGRVFPRAMKASPLLRAWLGRLASLGVTFRARHEWQGWDTAGGPLVAHAGDPVPVQADATILAFGGASWPRLGGDGGWVRPMAEAGIGVSPLRPANCGFVIAWSDHFRDRVEGTPLKNLRLSFEGATSRGDVVVTRTGLEGGALYALSAPLRDALEARGEVVLRIALRPDLARAEIERRLATRASAQSLSTFLRKALRLPPAAIALLHEAAGSAGALAAPALAALIDAVPVRLIAPAPIARAISTAGGIAWDEIDESFMLRRRPGTFVAGEMIDWEAPTGGYLLQACFATGAVAARGAMSWLRARNEIETRELRDHAAT